MVFNLTRLGNSLVFKFNPKDSLLQFISFLIGFIQMSFKEFLFYCSSVSIHHSYYFPTRHNSQQTTCIFFMTGMVLVTMILPMFLLHSRQQEYRCAVLSLLKPGATRCHGTRIARGVPLPVYINLDLYSGFWCTSRCVVFKYSVPPLTDQVLRKVLLTSWKEVNYCCLVSKRFIECPI